MALFLVSNLVINYLHAIFTDPGLPPESDESEDQNNGAHEDDDAAVQRDLESGARKKQCKQCFRLKPPRCHHCSVCKRCVLKMDHHCPWINNCVGYGNYRHFCLFMLFLAMSCVFAV